MLFIDMNDGKAHTLQALYRDWKTFSTEDPENHAPNFKTELFEILMATINGRNDLEIIGMASREISNYIIKLRKQIERSDENAVVPPLH